MYLKRIEIQGFKSFADPAVIDFKDGVTCIVGPNGSGKSNISDAMRWVLGEQRAKALRGGKMEEIIFAGAGNRRAKGMAEVTLVFDNSSGILDIDYAEVALKRRLFRSGESEYFINDNSCRLRDIRELIMDTGIGVDGYSFVGQGRIDRIASERPESRREVFEEAAGIIKYKTKRAEAERKLESAGTNLDRLSDLIYDIESRIDGLRTESEKAKEHQELSKRYRELQINITLKNIENLQKRNRELTAQFEEAGTYLETLRGDRVEFETKLAALRSLDTDLELRATEIREKLASNQTRRVSIAGEAAITEEKLKNIEKDTIRVQEEILRLTGRVNEREATLNEYRAKHAGFVEKLDRFAPELASLLTAAVERENIYNGKVVLIDERKAEHFELSREHSSKEAELASSESLVANFEETEAAIKRELISGETERAELAKRVADLEKDTEIKKEEVAALEKQGEALQEKYAATEKALANDRSTLDSIRIEIEKKLSRQKTIEEMIRNYEGYASGVRTLMQSKRPGVIGVVAELIKADAGFEAAIETALGAAAQNIVTEDDNAAWQAIEFLKKNKEGRLTFLPVKTIRENALEPEPVLEKTHGFSGYAMDRVTYDNKYKNVFRYLLGRTIIADTLDDAIAISAKKTSGWLIVTKEGEVISPAGALTGGTFGNKTANLLERGSEIDILKNEIIALDEKTLELREAAVKLTDESETLLVKIRETDLEKRDGETAYIRTQEERKSAEYMLARLDERLEKRRAELTGVEKDRGNSVDLIAGLRGTIERLRAGMEEIAIVIEDETTSLSSAKEAGEAARAEATELRLKSAEATRDKENADQTLQAMEDDLEETRDRLGAVLAEKAAIDNFSPELSEEETTEELKTLSEAKIGLDEELASVLSEREGVRSRIEDIDIALERSQEKIEAQVSSRGGMEVELGRQETRLATWKEKLFDEFELSYVHSLEYKNEDFVMSTAMRDNKEVKDRLKEIGEVNPSSIREYSETSERYRFLTAQRDDIVASMKDFQDIVRDMDKISKEKFRDTFEKISEAFSETFTLLFGGGKGQILLEDENDPLESGINIQVSPPGKNVLANIDSYSGGEKSMIAIALLFAILKTRPTPFCMLDEIDAALDEANIHRFARYVARFEGTQFTLVTHQRSTMEYADTLFGVTMQEQGVTTVLSLKLGDEETEAFAESLNG